MPLFLPICLVELYTFLSSNSIDIISQFSFAFSFFNTSFQQLSPSLPNDASLSGYMLAHGPFYGALDIRVWDPQSDSFNYSLIFNDSSVHSLPILVNAANNARYPIIPIVSFIFLFF